ncbi:hypothetical protein LCGC14_2033190, partial [marine sediment metagenome]
TLPTYSSFTNNASTLTKINGVVNWSINLSDETALSYYFFAHNNSGTMTNVSNGTLSGTSVFLNKTVTITKPQGNYICGQFWVNDTSNNINQTLLTDSEACFTVANTIPGIPTITSPIDGDINKTRNIAFTTTDADGDTISYTLYINNTINVTTNNNITGWVGADGYYNLTITANDSSGFSANSTVVHFTLDSTVPIIANITVAGLNRSGDTFYVNFTAMDNLTDINWTVSQNQSGTWQNTTWSNTWTVSGDWLMAIYSATITATKNTWFGIIGYVKDAAGNIAQSTMVLLQVENIPPTVTNFTFPNQSIYRININITMNWSNSFDADGDTINYRLWLGDVSPPTWLYYDGTDSNFTTNLSDGTYYYSVDVYDGQDYNLNTSIWRLDVDTIGPVLYQNFSDDIETSLNYFLVNYTVTDEGDLWSINSTVVYNTTGVVVCSNETINISTNAYNYVYNCSLPVSDGIVYNGTVIAYDAHTANSFTIAEEDISIIEATRKFDFDGTTIQMTSTTGNIDLMEYEALGDRYSFRFKMKDMPILDKEETYHYIFKLPADAYYLASSRYQAHFIIPSQKRGIDFEGVDGTFNISKTTVHLYTTETDLAFNSVFQLNNVTDTFQFTADNQPPRINYTSPTPGNNSITTGNSVTVNISITDANFANCTLEWGGTNETMIQGTDYCYQTKTTTDGQGYYFKVYVNDTYSNTNITGIRNITENSLPTATLLN